MDIVENNWTRDQQAKKQDRKVLGWSSGEEDNQEAVSPNDVQVILSSTPKNPTSQPLNVKHGAIKQLANQIKIENELEQEDLSQS